MLASASNAIIIGFNVRPLADARRAADREGVDVRTYSVIYKITEDLRNAMEGMLETVEVEEALGEAEVKEIFKASKIGKIAGCVVTEGKVGRTARSAWSAKARSSGPASSARCAASRTTSGGRGGPGVRHRARRLRRRQGRRRTRVLPDQTGRADPRVGTAVAGVSRMRRVNEVMREVIGATISADLRTPASAS